MKPFYRVYAAWSPFWRRIGSKPVAPSIVYKSIGVHLPLFITKRACKQWIDTDTGRRKTFGLFPARVAVTIEYANPPQRRERGGRSGMKLTPAQLKVLSVIYMATDCSNEVYDYATLRHTQRRIAEAMPKFVEWIDGCTPVDGDGFAPDTYTERRGYRLTELGYEALTKADPEQYPPDSRRFADATKGGAE